jgi:hypothetical protein
MIQRIQTPKEATSPRQSAARCAGLRDLLAGWNPDEHPELRALIDKLGRELVSQIPTPVPAAT